MKRVGMWMVVAALAVPVGLLAQETGKAPAKAPAKTTAEAKGGARTVEITATDTGGKYAYSVTTINAKPGEQLHVVLKAVGNMPAMASSHNFVVFKPGTKQADIDAFIQEAPMAGATGYIPADKKNLVLASTPMTADGSQHDVTFAAPTTPGTYTYLCSFPGHYAAGMKGTLVVK